MRIAGVDREADDAEPLGVLVCEAVVERQPAAVGGIPAEGAADVGARVKQVKLRRVKHEAGDETAATDGDVAPGIRLKRKRSGGVGLGRVEWGGGQGSQQRQASERTERTSKEGGHGTEKAERLKR